MKIPVIITVRSNSSRLPRKCFLRFGKGCVLEHIIWRAKYYELEPIVCTTNEKSDDDIINLCNDNNTKYFRGSSINKLLRWSLCCNQMGIEEFHTVDADDPFFCGEEVTRSFDLMKSLFCMR